MSDEDDDRARVMQSAIELGMSQAREQLEDFSSECESVAEEHGIERGKAHQFYTWAAIAYLAAVHREYSRGSIGIDRYIEYAAMFNGWAVRPKNLEDIFESTETAIADLMRRLEEKK